MTHPTPCVEEFVPSRAERALSEGKGWEFVEAVARPKMRIVKDTGLMPFPHPAPKRHATRSVYFIPADDAGCGWLRCLLPALALSECTDWHADGAWGLRYDMRQIKDYDVVVFQRQGSGAALDNMKRCRARGQLVVYEIDDWALSAAETANPTSPYYDKMASRSMLVQCMRTADLITVTTPRLSDSYTRYNKRLAVLPNCTHPDINHPALDTYHEGCPVTVAYASALAHSNDAALLRAVIPSVVARHPDTHFLFFGDWPRRDWQKELKNTYRMDFLPLRGYYHALTLFDIGLAPLCSNIFTLHKSNLKALDYLGAGVAPVLQDHPVYAEFKHGRDCLKAQNTKDWIHLITLLLESPTLRDDLVHHGQRWVRHYDYRNHAHQWAAAYESALSRTRKPPA